MCEREIRYIYPAPSYIRPERIMAAAGYFYIYDRVPVPNQQSTAFDPNGLWQLLGIFVYMTGFLPPTSNQPQSHAASCRQSGAPPSCTSQSPPRVELALGFEPITLSSIAPPQTTTLRRPAPTGWVLVDLNGIDNLGYSFGRIWNFWPPPHQMAQQCDYQLALG